MNIGSFLGGFLVGVISNYIYRCVTYFLGNTKIEICKYLIKTSNRSNIPALQFKIINKSYKKAVDIDLTLRGIKYRNDDKTLKESTIVGRYHIDYLRPREFLFKTNKSHHNAFRGHFVNKMSNIHEVVSPNFFDEIEIFLKAYNIFNNSLFVNNITIPIENIKGHEYEFNIGSKCQSPSEILNKKKMDCKISNKELLSKCPFLNMPNSNQ